MRWFLDMCIVLYYIGEGDRPDLNKKTLNFVREKGEDDFLLCYYIKEIDIQKWINRQRILFREVIKQIREDDYIPYSSDESEKLYERDKKKVIKLITFLKNRFNQQEAIKKSERLLLEMEGRIKEFINDYIDYFVIPMGEIDKELRSHLMSFINIGQVNKNYSDASALASGIQEHQSKELVMITADKQDWNKDLIEEVHNDIFLKKKYPKLPEIKYLQDL